MEERILNIITSGCSLNHAAKEITLLMLEEKLKIYEDFKNNTSVTYDFLWAKLKISEINQEIQKLK